METLGVSCQLIKLPSLFASSVDWTHTHTHYKVFGKLQLNLLLNYKMFFFFFYSSCQEAHSEGTPQWPESTP